MNLISRPSAVTFEEFCLLVKEDEKADLIDGVIYMASPESIEGNELVGWLFRLVAGFVEERDLGRVYVSRIAFRLGPTQGPEPEIAFVRKDRLRLRRRGYFDGPPDLAIEVVSPDSVERDYVKKREQYRKAGVTEYWIIDDVEQKVTVYRLAPRGRYQEVRPKKGVLRSQVLPGFWLRPGWLWQDPRPKKTRAAKSAGG
jgi:Uma2 family endonuclease